MNSPAMPRSGMSSMRGPKSFSVTASAVQAPVRSASYHSNSSDNAPSTARTSPRPKALVDPSDYLDPSLPHELPPCCVVASPLSRARAGDHKQILVVEFRWTFGRALIRPRGEFQEVPVERCGPLGLLGDACVDRDHRPEGRLDEVAIAARTVGPLNVGPTHHLQRLQPVAKQLPDVLLATPHQRR